MPTYRALLKPLAWTALAIALSGAAIAQIVAPVPAPAPTTPAPRAAAALPANEAVATATAPPIPLLWKVSDADNEVYLLGSFHLLKPDDYPLSRDVDLAFVDAEALVFELAPEEMASPQLGMQMGQAALRTDGTRLSDALPPQTASRLDAWVARNGAALAKQGIQPQALQMFEPWFVALMVTLTGMAEQGLDASLGLDAHMAARAARAQKPTSGLETGAQQIAFLDGMGAAEQQQFLEEALGESGQDGSDVRKLHAAWRAGDAETMWSGMALEMRTRYPALYQRINVARNDAWVPKIEARLARAGRDDTLVVVGALHLLGEDGIVEKLRARGHAVERICSACNAPSIAPTMSR